MSVVATTEATESTQSMSDHYLTIDEIEASLSDKDDFFIKELSRQILIEVVSATSQGDLDKKIAQIVVAARKRYSNNLIMDIAHREAARIIEAEKVTLTRQALVSAQPIIASSLEEFNSLERESYTEERQDYYETTGSAAVRQAAKDTIDAQEKARAVNKKVEELKIDELYRAQKTERMQRIKTISRTTKAVPFTELIAGDCLTLYFRNKRRALAPLSIKEQGSPEKTKAQRVLELIVIDSSTSYCRVEHDSLFDKNYGKNKYSLRDNSRVYVAIKDYVQEQHSAQNLLKGSRLAFQKAADSHAQVGEYESPKNQVLWYAVLNGHLLLTD